VKTTSTIAALLISSSVSFSQVLYDVDFNDQPVDQLPIIGVGPNYISGIYPYGSPTVVSSFGGLVDQPLQFQLHGNLGPFRVYDQIELNLRGLDAQQLDLSFDFSSVGFVGYPSTFLTVVFDTPEVRPLQIQSDGTFLLSPYPFSRAGVGAFTDGEVFRMHIHVDLAAQQWSIYKNDEFLDSAPFIPSGSMRTVRISFSSYLAPGSASVGIDNILFTVPEPRATKLILVAGLSVFGIGHRRVRIRR
jgi:hypothetical protein